MRAGVNEIWQNLKWRLQHALCHLDRMSVETFLIMFGPERLERSGPLLTVKTEANGASKSTNKSEPFLVCCWACAAEQEIFVLPWLLLSAQYKIKFSSLYTFSIPLSPLPASMPGSRAGSPVS